MTATRVRSVCLLALLGTACVPEIMDDLSFIARSRILAVRAAEDCDTAPCPAEVDPKKRLPARFEALVASPEGTPEPAITWTRCDDPKPLTEIGPVSPKCLSKSASGDVAAFIGTGTSISNVEVPDEACRFFGPEAPPPKNGQPGGRPTDPDLTGGYYQPVIAFLGDEPTLGAIRLDCGPGNADTLEYRDRYRQNANPAVDSLTANASGATTIVAPWNDASPPELAEVHSGDRVILKAEWARCPSGGTPVPNGCTGSETFAWVDPSSDEILDRRESILVSWYASAGHFESRRTGVLESDPNVPSTDNGWIAPSQTGIVKLWLVIRDDRGGVGWETYRIDVR